MMRCWESTSRTWRDCKSASRWSTILKAIQKNSPWSFRCRPWSKKVRFTSATKRSLITWTPTLRRDWSNTLMAVHAHWMWGVNARRWCRAHRRSHPCAPGPTRWAWRFKRNTRSVNMTSSFSPPNKDKDWKRGSKKTATVSPREPPRFSAAISNRRCTSSLPEWISRSNRSWVLLLCARFR